MYLNREQSNTIKGILIILIVFGHNHFLCPNTESGGMMDYLYLFHIHGFFILPFFYQTSKGLSWPHIVNIVVRNWIPYLWICALCWLSYSVVSQHYDFGWGHIGAFLNGTQSPIRKYFGFVFPWFLPTYCSFSILLLIARRYKWFMCVVALLGFCTLLMTWEQFFLLKNTLPFGIGLALNYFVSGVMAFYLNRCNSWVKYGGAFVFVVLSICWWLHLSVGVLMNFMPTMFFLSLLLMVPYVNIRLLRMLGKYSLGIYLIHMFIINVMYAYLPHDWWWGWTCFLISLLVPLIWTIMISKSSCVSTVLFPKSWNNLIHLYKF